MNRSVLLAALSIALAPAILPGQPFVMDSSSAVNGWFCWQGSLPHTEYRYAECSSAMFFSEGLARPTYLNAILRRDGSGGVVDVYIDTAELLPEASQEFWNGAWINWGERESGHYVGSATPTSQNAIYSWDIDEWIQANPTTNWYYILFDGRGTGGNVVAYQTWVGREANAGLAMAEPVPAGPGRGATARAVPNPTAGPASIQFSVGRGGPVSAFVTDVSGRRVKVLLDSRYLPAGTQRLTWNGADDQGARLPEGAYLYRVELPGQIIQGKLILR